MNKIIHISMIEPVGGHGGVEFYDIGLCEAISKQGFKVTLYTCDETTLDKKFNLQTCVKKVYKKIYGKDNKFIRGSRYIRGTLKALLDAKLNKSQIAHFHIYNFDILEYINLKLFKLFGFKIVITVHDVERLDKLDNKKHYKIYNKFAKISDVIIVHTKHTKNELLKYLDKTLTRKIKIVTHGDIDFLYNKNIDKMTARKKLGLKLSDKDFLILFFGQIKEVKGLDILIKAFYKIHKEIPNSYLLIAGKPWQTSFTEYDNLIKKLKIADNRVIKHIKFIKNEDVPLYFKASDLVILPYKKVYNSGVVLRAMDYECVVLASDLNPFKEIIKHGYNGLIFKSKNIDDLARNIEHLYLNTELKNKLKMNAKKTIESKYSWDVIGKEMKEIYKSLITNGV